MKKLIGLMALLCLAFNSYGQKMNIVDPLYINDRLPDLTLSHIINYPDGTAKLSSFGHKLVILDFWSVHCTTCIHMFPLEDSLQQVFKDSVQFILVTMDSTKKVQKFLYRWDSLHATALSIPVVTSDDLLHRLFRFQFIPHYVWLMPNGTILAQTSEDFINAAIIRETLHAIRKKEEELKEDGFGQEMFCFPPLTDKQKQKFAPFHKNNISL